MLGAQFRRLVVRVVTVFACIQYHNICRADDPAANPSSTPAAEAASPDFNQAIVPLLRKYCSGCHNPTDKEHGLNLETYEGLLAGGNDGSVIFAGKSDQSRLILMVRGKLEPKMPPPGNDGPSEDEIALLAAWIDAGAKSPSGAPPDPTLLVTPKVKLLAPARQVTNAVAISPDGKLAAVAGYQEVRIVSLESRGILRTLTGHRGNVTDVSFSTDGARLVSAAGEPGVFGEVIVWNVADGTNLKTIVGHRDSLYAVALSPDGTKLATGGYDQQIKLWDASSGNEILTIQGHNGAVYDLAFNKDGNILASASADRTIKLWSVADGSRLDTLGQPIKEQYSVIFTPDGKFVIGAGVDNRIRIWEIMADGKEGTNPLRITRFAHEGAILRLAISGDGKTLTSSADDKTIRVWNLPELAERYLLEPQPDWAAALALSPDGNTLLAGRLDGSLAFYNPSTSSLLPPPVPELASLWPRAIGRGETRRVRLSGKALLGNLQVKSSDPAVSVLALAEDDASGNSRWIEVQSKPDAVPGAISLTAVNEGGASKALSLSVEASPQIEELEPNDKKPADNVVVPRGESRGLWGKIAKKGDIDEWQIEAEGGQTLVIDLAANRIGSTLNASLLLLDSRGMVVASSSDFFGRPDPLLSFKPPSDGTYTLRVADESFTGSDTHIYQLNVGPFPLVLSAYPTTIKAQTATNVELAGLNIPPGTMVAVAPSPAGEVVVSLDPLKFRSLAPIKVMVADQEDVPEVEPNDLPGSATPLAIGAVASGRMTSAGAEDVDLYRFEIQAGESVVIETEAQRRGSPLDTKLEVLHADGTPVERMVLQAVRDSYIEFRGFDSNAGGLRPKNWEEMELNEFMYVNGEVCKIFRMPQGPDSEVVFYASGGRRRCFFDTSATAHALDENVYTVVPYPAGTVIPSNGLPQFHLNYSNDDDGLRQLGSDSRLTFTAPAAGTYLIRVSDVRGFKGDHFVYRLFLRSPRPDFSVSLADVNPNISRGSGKRLTFNASRQDGFDGPITIDISGLPPGFTATAPVTIEAGHDTAKAVLHVAADAAVPPAEAWSNVKITAKADVNQQGVERSVNALGQVVIADKPKISVRIEPAELTIAPGTTITATLMVERNGFDDRITFDVDNLPFGVIVDNIGLNGVLIPEGQTQRQIFLTASKITPESSRRIHAVANNANNEASGGVTLHVRRQPALAAQDPAAK